MPLEPQNVEVLLEGLDQKTDHKVIKAGKLVVAQNVEFDKTGSLRKRRGFRRYHFADIGALGVTMETQAHRVISHEGELLICGVSWLWSFADVNEAIDGKACVRRGRLSAGNLKVLHVGAAEEATDATTTAVAAT